MRILLLILFSILISANARAFSITAMNNATTIVSGATTTFYFPVIGTTAGVNTACATANRYPSTLTNLDATSTTAGILYFDITASKTRDVIFGATATTGTVSIAVENSAGSLIALAPTGTHSPVATSPNKSKYIQYETDGATQRFGISLPDVTTPEAGSGLCFYLNAILPSYYPLADCQSSTPPSITVKFGIISTNTLITSNSTGDINSSEVYNIVLGHCPPNTTANVITAPDFNYTLTPGDARFKIENNTVAPTPGTLPLQSLLVVADSDSTTTTMTSEVVRSFQGATGSSTNYVSGLQNDVRYCVSIGYVNAAGFVSDLINPTSQCVTPSVVEGFLNRSTCFVATAAYGEEWDTRLETLRQFRDQLLLRSKPGRAFVDWYYSWSPKAAHYIWDRPSMKFAVRTLLLPIVVAAEVSLWLKGHGVVSLVLLGFLFFIMIFAVFRSRRLRKSSALFMCVLVFFILPSAQAAAPSAAEMKNPQEMQPYIESLKAGHKLQPKYSKKARKAAGIALVTSNNFDITSTQTQANSFNNVYKPGEKYAFSVSLFYEHHLVRHPYAGAFGPYAQLNVITLKGKGIFTRFGTHSDDTRFSYYAVPLTLGGAYRYTTQGIVQPFVQIGVAAIPIMESRDDDKPNLRALSAGFATNL